MILEDLCSVLSFPFHVCQQDCPGRRSQVAYQGKVRLLSLIEVFCLLAVHFKFQLSGNLVKFCFLSAFRPQCFSLTFTIIIKSCTKLEKQRYCDINFSFCIPFASKIEMLSAEKTKNVLSKRNSGNVSMVDVT